MPRQKLGRNDSCWCGSGKKYKHCHLGLEDQTPLPISEVLKRFNQANSAKTCLVPSTWKDKCHAEISSAHTVPKGSLKQIARNEHVYSFKPNLMNLRKNQGVLVPELARISHHSKFWAVFVANIYIISEDHARVPVSALRHPVTSVCLPCFGPPVWFFQLPGATRPRSAPVTVLLTPGRPAGLTA